MTLRKLAIRAPRLDRRQAECYQFGLFLFATILLEGGAPDFA
jgi:hypothetical protein